MMQSTDIKSPLPGDPLAFTSNLDAVIFDWDGVLVDSGRNYYLAYQKVFEELGIATTPREIYLREGQPTPQLIATICQERGVTISSSKIQELVEQRRSHDVALGPRQFFPGIWGFLDRLRADGFKLAIVTGSSRKSVKMALTPEHEQEFDVIITADDVARPKPDPQPFVFASTRLGVEPSRCAVVENAPYGVRGARAAGCPVIAICTTLAAEDLNEAERVVQNHRELEAMFVPGRRLSADGNSERTS